MSPFPKSETMKKTAEIVNSILAVFSAYSRIPVPPARWDGETLRWQICSFPLVGCVIGALFCAAGILLGRTGMHPVFAGAILGALPLLLTGGIHMDGFLDTTDAIHSWKSKEERIRILDDPHVGAFALIYGAIYLMLYLGACCQLASGGEMEPFLLLIPAFVLSRTLSGLSVVYFPKAKKDGMLKTSADGASKNAGKILIGWLIFVTAVTVWAAIALGRPEMALLPVLCGLVFLYYYRTALALFGGVSGDLAGWFLSNCELVCLLAAAMDCLLRI